MLSTAAGRREEDEENGTEILLVRSKLDGLVSYGDHEEGPIDSFDCRVRYRYSIADDRRVKFFHEGQAIHDLTLALDQTSLGERISQEPDHLIARVGAEATNHRIVFNEIY